MCPDNVHTWAQTRGVDVDGATLLSKVDLTKNPDNVDITAQCSAGNWALWVLAGPWTLILTLSGRI